MLLERALSNWMRDKPVLPSVQGVQGGDQVSNLH